MLKKRILITVKRDKYQRFFFTFQYFKIYFVTHFIVSKLHRCYNSKIAKSRKKIKDEINK